jgi:hypothetical protein
VIELAASETTIVLIAAAAGALAFALTTAIVVLVFFAAFEPEEGCVNDVQRFIELTEEARSLRANGSDASDIERFQAKKAEARKALSESRLTPAA